MQRIDCQVESLSNLAETIFRVRLKPAQTVSFKAGQYLMVVMSEEDKRPFSIASSPEQPDEIELHIGASDHSPYAQQVIEQMRTGQCTVELAAGDAWLREDSERPLLLIAGGTGYSYVHSILHHHLHTGSQRPVHVYWGARSRDQLYDHEQLTALAKANPRLSYIPVLMFPDDDWHGRQGLVHERVLDDIQDLDQYDIYVAGRFEMAGAVRKVFRDSGYKLDHLYGDAFAFI